MSPENSIPPTLTWALVEFADAKAPVEFIKDDAQSKPARGHPGRHVLLVMVHMVYQNISISEPCLGEPKATPYLQ